MKSILTTMIVASACAFGQETAPEPSLKPGSMVSLEPLAAATWVQGEALTAFEPGKVYIFECWATWCAPCIAAIPHVNGLHKKYHDRGLRVYGMNVWEDGLDKVEKFVSGKGEGMSYPVAYTGKGSPFEEKWLKAAGVRGIPHAFIVKDGKFLLSAHPARITDSMIEILLTEEDPVPKIEAEMNAPKANGNENVIPTMMKKIAVAEQAKDPVAMAEAVAEFEEKAPSSTYLSVAKINLAILKQDWAGASETIRTMSGEGINKMTISQFARKATTEAGAGYPKEFTQTILTKFNESLSKDERLAGNPLVQVTLSQLQWRTDDKETSLKTADKAVELATKPQKGKGLPAEPFQRFATAVKDGNPPNSEEFVGWIRTAMAAAKAAAAEEPPAAE